MSEWTKSFQNSQRPPVLALVPSSRVRVCMSDTSSVLRRVFLLRPFPHAGVGQSYSFLSLISPSYLLLGTYPSALQGQAFQSTGTVSRGSMACLP